MGLPEYEVANKISLVLFFAFNWRMRDVDLVLIQGALTPEPTDDEIVEATANHSYVLLFGRPNQSLFRLRERKQHARYVLVEFSANVSEEERRSPPELIRVLNSHGAAN